MRLLLDTHAFLWFILDDPQLSNTADTLIADPNNDVVISPASYWEIATRRCYWARTQTSLIIPDAIGVSTKPRTALANRRAWPRCAVSHASWSAGRCVRAARRIASYRRNRK